jgi:predicted dithiol-disulfide oxidoreductase (DUF899 family)
MSSAWSRGLNAESPQSKEDEMSLPQVASRDEWLAARKALLAEEKELTRQRDALNAKRRMLPMVEIDKRYVFAGPGGEASLLELFEGRRQLILGHFMFDPGWDDGCPSCSAGCDEISQGLLDHLHARDTTLAYVSRAPLEKLEDYKARKGWSFPWYSSHGSDFIYDFHVTLDESVAPVEYNYRAKAEHQARGVTLFDAEQPIEMPGTSYFLRDGERVFHTYSNFARGAEATGGSYYWLDLTALGRQEDWEEPRGRADHAHSATPNFDD